MNMKLNTLTKWMKWFSTISLACAATSLVGVPVNIDYNGSLADDNGILLDGDYFFKFAIAPEVPADATEIYWSNAPWDAGAGMPDSALEVSVSQGVFSVVLEAVDATVLGNADLTLHVWLSDEVAGTYEYLGANPINSVPYAILASYAEGVNADDIAGKLQGSQIADGAITASLIADGSIDAEKLGTIMIDVPFLDADGDGQPDDPADRRVSLQSIIESISTNSALTFNDVNANRMDFEVFLRRNQPVGAIEGWAGGSPAAGEFKDPFPIGQAYEYNGGLMPHISIIDADGNDITGQTGTPIPGLTFVAVTEDVESTSPGTAANDGLLEPRLVVRGAPTTNGDYTVRVKASNRWGMDFVQEYTVRVRDVNISGGVIAERQAMGSSTWTSSLATTPFGGDPVRFRFVVRDVNNNVIPLADDVLVRWTYPRPTSSGNLTSDILGPTGQIFYVNSTGTPAGTGSSQGAIHLDEDPLNSVVSHIGTYQATILFDWGQGISVGSSTMTAVQEGFAFTANAIQYNAPAIGTSDLFDQFTHTAGAYPIGQKTVASQVFGATPAGDEPSYSLLGVIEGGDTTKRLIGENPFFLIPSGSYIRGSMENKWIQQKVERYWTGTSWASRVVDVRDLNRTAVTNGVAPEPAVQLFLNGFGPSPASASWPISLGAGMISDRANKRGSFTYPEDGGELTFNSTFSARARPVTPTNAWSYLQNIQGDMFITYWQYSTNGFIDSLAPITAIVEVGSNINIVNDLLPVQQVAGYPAMIGGDFGTTNGAFTTPLFPDPVSTASQIIAWGINDLAYIWDAVNNPRGNGFSLVNPANANSILVPPQSMVNYVTSNDASVDFRYSLELDSGFSAEEASEVNVSVVSDVVVYDFYLQEIDLNFNPSDVVNYFPQDGAKVTTEESVVIDQGDDVLWTVEAYIRPSLLTGLDEGWIGSTVNRDLNARFFLVPTATNQPVEITNNITKMVDSVYGYEVDTTGNHVQPLEGPRKRFRWEVILENPLQQIGATNIATGYVYAVITSTRNGQVVNTVSTLGGSSMAIAPTDAALGINDDTDYTFDLVTEAIIPVPLSAAEEDAVGPNFRLDARVKMPLSSSEATITVNPLVPMPPPV